MSKQPEVVKMRAGMGRREWMLASIGGALAGAAALPPVALAATSPVSEEDLWSVWDSYFARAKYVYLTHVLTPESPLWYGFRNPQHPPSFKPALITNDGGKHFHDENWDTDGHGSYRVELPGTDWGTHIDAPSEFHPCQAAMEEIPATYSLRKLVVISIAEQAKRDIAYQMTLDDVQAWEGKHGAVPAGSVVMVRSDWYKNWNENPKRFLAEDGRFPGIRIEAIRYLHEERKILFHGHEAMDTDTTPTLLSEDWVLSNGYPQVECVANLDLVPETGALVAFGVPRLRGTTAFLLALAAICAPSWPHGQTPGFKGESPLPFHDKRLTYDTKTGMFEREQACTRPNGKMGLNK